MLCKGDIVRHWHDDRHLVRGLGLVVSVLPESATVLWLKAGYQARHENHWLVKVEVRGA
jgi:hypothetical protein